jgi:hypothetical protein
MRLDLSHPIVLEKDNKGGDEKLLNPNPIKNYQDMYLIPSPGTDKQKPKKTFAASISFTTNHNNNTTERDLLNNNTAIVYV